MDLQHVRYVTGDGPHRDALEVLRTAWTDPWGLFAAACVVVGVAAYLWVTTRWSTWQAFRQDLDQSLAGDHDLVPWVLRLSVGIAIMAAGLQAHWFLPHLDIPVRGILAFVLLAAGFAVLLGLAVRVAAAALLAVWLAGLAVHGPDLFMAAETVAALVVLLAGAAGRPSMDGYLASALPSAPRPWRALAGLKWLLGPTGRLPPWTARALQVGVGISFAAAGILEKLADPGPAIATAQRYQVVFEPFSAEVVVATAGLLETALGVLLILGVAPRPLAALGFLVLTVTLFALPDDPVAAHVPLWGVASAVFLLGKR